MAENHSLNQSELQKTQREILESVSDLAPLHNPANLVGIRAAEKLMPDTVQVAVFDSQHFTLQCQDMHSYTLFLSHYINDIK